MKRVCLLLLSVVFLSGCALLGARRNAQPVESSAQPTRTPLQTTPTNAPAVLEPTANLSIQEMVDPVSEDSSAHIWVKSIEVIPESSDASHLIGEVVSDECVTPDNSWNSANSDPETLLILSFLEEITPENLRIHFAGELSVVDHVELLNHNTGYSLLLQTYDAEITRDECRSIASFPTLAEAGVTQALIFINGTAGELLLDGVELVGAPPMGDTTPVYWRMGGSRTAADATLQEPVALVVDSYGQVMVGDAVSGIVIYDWEGNYVQTINPAIQGRMVDLDSTGQGNLVITDRDQAEIIVLDPGGMELLRFGSRGPGDGQFGQEGPLAAVIFPNEEIGYILDRGPVQGSENQYRIQTFDFTSGAWIQTLPLPSEVQAETILNMAIDSYGFLYFSIEKGEYIYRYEPGYDTASRYAEESLNGTFPAALAFNAQGELYLAAQSQPNGVAIHLLDALGYGYRQLGELTQPTSEADWAEGRFFHPTAIQADPFGQFLFVSDYSTDYAYLTCYQLFSFDELGN